MKTLITAAVCACILFSTTFLDAQPPNETLPPTLRKYVTQDTLALGHIDISGLQPKTVVQWLLELGLLDTAEQQDAKAFAAEIESLQSLGVPRIYALLRSRDQMQPTLIVPFPSADKAAECKRLVSALVGRSGFPRLHVAATDNELLLSTSAIVARSHTPDGTPDRPDVAAGYREIQNESIGFVFVADDTSRTVVRDLFPRLPAPYEDLTGPMVADDVQWITFMVDPPPALRIRLVAEASTPQTAAVLSQVTQRGLQQLATSPTIIADEGLRSSFKQLLSSLTPTQRGSRLQLSTNDALLDSQNLQRVLAAPLRKSRENAKDQRTVNQLRSLQLGLLNYESATRQFPAYATFDNQQPLLSWRVHILPYLREMELYQQFRLDEPWNSEHNLPLQKKMPQVYRDPRNRPSNEQGLTRLQCPIGKGLFFEGTTPNRINSFTDGTSRTISVLQVNSDLAVPWTKPADWEVDQKRPWMGIRPTTEGDKLFAVFVDGSVHRFSSEMDRNVLRAILTRNGAEPISNEDLKR